MLHVGNWTAPDSDHHSGVPDDLTIAIAAARAGSAAALAHRGGHVTRKDDDSPVSAGDHAADAAIAAVLRHHRPDDGLLSEERVDDARRLDCQRTWIVDPIDGTRAYIGDGGDWAVQVALVVDGVARIGVLAQPARGRFVAADIAGPCVEVADDGSRTPLTISHASRNHMLCSRRIIDEMRPVGAAIGCTVSPLSSVGVKVLALIDGLADLYLHPQPIHEWDVAAPIAVLIAAGGWAGHADARPLRFNRADPSMADLVCSTRDDTDELLSRIDPSIWTTTR